jgi:flagellar protein FlbB
LGVIQVSSFFAPLYRVMGLAPQTSSAPSSPDRLVEADLDNDRFAKRIESQNIRTEELDKRESDVKKKEDTNTQVAQELTDKQTELEEKEKTFNNEVKKYDNRKDNIEKIVQNLVGMQPKNAVNIMVDMDDQDIIDVLRRADEDAAAAGASSMVAYWLSLMPPDRAAEIQRKMANKPASIDE